MAVSRNLERIYFLGATRLPCHPSTSSGRLAMTVETKGRRSKRRPHLYFSESGQIETIQVHDLGPGCHEVMHELLLRVVLGIDFGQGP